MAEVIDLIEENVPLHFGMVFKVPKTRPTRKSSTKAERKQAKKEAEERARIYKAEKNKQFAAIALLNQFVRDLRMVHPDFPVLTTMRSIRQYGLCVKEERQYWDNNDMGFFRRDFYGLVTDFKEDTIYPGELLFHVSYYEKNKQLIF
jgi:hypothetical protein